MARTHQNRKKDTFAGITDADLAAQVVCFDLEGIVLAQGLAPVLEMALDLFAVEAAFSSKGRIFGTVTLEGPFLDYEPAGWQPLHMIALHVNALLSDEDRSVDPTFGPQPTVEIRNSLRGNTFNMVLRKGLEPLRLTAHAPQTCVSTNSTT